MAGENEVKEVQEQVQKTENQLQKIDEKLTEKFEEIKNLAPKEDVTQLQEQIKELDENRQKESEELAKLKADMKNGFQPGGQPQVKKLKDREKYQELRQKEGIDGRMDISDMMQKANMTVPDNFTGDVIRPDRDPAIYTPPQQPIHVRQVVETRPTESDVVEIVRETSRTDNVTQHTGTSVKSQSEASFEIAKFEVIDFAHKYDMTRRMFMDAGWLEAWIRNEGRQALMDKEDDELLNGTGDIQGLFGIAQDFDTASFTDEVSDRNKIDVLVWACQQLFYKFYRPTRIYLNPQDAFSIRLEKNADGDYLLNVPVGMGDLQFVGVPIIAHTTVPKGEFLVADNDRGNYIADRMTTEIRFSEENNDNFERNMVTARIEKRFAHVITFEDAFVAGTFDTILSAT